MKKPSDNSDSNQVNLDHNLSGLFEAITDAVSEMASRLESGTKATVPHDHVFESKKGPIHAQAGVKLRLGGLGEEETTASPAPFHPTPQRQETKDKTPQRRTVHYDLIVNEDSWMLIADLPGINLTDLEIECDHSVMNIETKGARIYSASVTLDGNFDTEAMTSQLHNGILTLQMPRKPA